MNTGAASGTRKGAKKAKGRSAAAYLMLLLFNKKAKHERQKTKLRVDAKNQRHTNDWGSHPI